MGDPFNLHASKPPQIFPSFIVNFSYYFKIKAKSGRRSNLGGTEGDLSGRETYQENQKFQRIQLLDLGLAPSGWKKERF
jgi:hypothetical protein